MITIQKIHIKNFRSLADETITLSDYNFFVGKNDSGKSNVLKALNLFFNNTTDFNTEFDFESDYSKFAKRGQKQAKEIVIALEILVPDSYKESGIKVWKKVWRADGLHSDNLKTLFKSGSKGFTLFSRIKYMYIPAVKSNEYFKYLLSEVYLSMMRTANSSLKELNERYSDRLQVLTSDLSDQLKTVLNINSAIQMPRNLNIIFRDLTFQTSDKYVKNIDLNHRGDGIKARHIPSILRYMQQNLEKNKLPNSISHSFIWGFEEPENGVEYISCFDMADELYSYRKECQMLITTHSPAFYMKNECDDASCFFVYKDETGTSKYTNSVSKDKISADIGFLPLISPFIKEEQEKYRDREGNLRRELEEIRYKYDSVVGRIIIITEGKTDVKHIKTAFQHLKLDQHIIDKIEYYDFSNNQNLGEELGKLLDKLSNIHRDHIVIGIFDRDQHIQENDRGKSYKTLRNNVFRFNIPQLDNDERKPDDNIAIEHYYSNAEIEIETDHGHLYMGKDFDKFGKSSDENWFFVGFANNSAITPLSIIDSSKKQLNKINDKAKIISKNDFADYVMENPEKFDFTNFKKIFDVICEINTDSNNH